MGQRAQVMSPCQFWTDQQHDKRIGEHGSSYDELSGEVGRMLVERVKARCPRIEKNGSAWRCLG